MLKSKVLYLSIPILLTACGNLSSIHRTLDVDDGTGALIDIKQRAIIVSKHESVTGTDSNQTIKSQTFVCAEPSPDAMSAYASETSLSVPDKIKLANAFQEGTTFTGLRTQSIQLLRDGMYRLCEARMSGALDNGEYNLLLRRYQKNMVALIAIEQLTGTVKAPVTVISTTGSASLAQDIDESEAKLESLQNDLANLNSQLATEKAKGKSANNADTVKSLETKIANKKSLINALIQGIANNRSMLASGTATASVANQAQKSSASIGNTNVDNVSATVEKIVTAIVDTDDLPAMCFSHLNSVKSGNSSQLTLSCQSLVADMINSRNAVAETQIKIANGYIKKGEFDKAERTIRLIEHTIQLKNYTPTLGKGVIAPK
ncbi:TPA: hypothetical protein ACN331_002388 [Vibrio parahaemolyticus]